MLVPANRRNPVRIGAEAALQGATAAANMLSKISQAARMIEQVKPLVSAASNAVRGKRSKRRNGSNIISSQPFQAPVTQGFTFRSNQVGSYKQCSRFGMTGTKVSGEQLFAIVAAAAATDGWCLNDPIGGPGNYFSACPVVPCQTTATVGASGIIGYVRTLDPLFTQSIIYRRYVFTKLQFIFVPQRGTGENETLTLAFVPNGVTQTADVQTASALESFEISVTGPVWAPLALDVSRNLPLDRLFVTSFANPTQNDPDAYEFWQGMIAANIVGNTVLTTYGRLFVRYEVEIYGKQPYPSGVAFGQQNSRKTPCGNIPGEELKVGVQPDQKSDCVVDSPVVLERASAGRGTMPAILSNNLVITTPSESSSFSRKGEAKPESDPLRRGTVTGGWFGQ